MREWIDNEMEREHREELHTAIRRVDAERARRRQDRRKKLDEIAVFRAKRFDAKRPGR